MYSNIILITSFLLYFIIILLINLGNTELCDECITPNPENKKGWCVQAKYCTYFGDIVGVPLSRFLTKYQTFIRNSKCSDNGAENYCCAESLIEPTFFDEGNQFCNITIVEPFQPPVIFHGTNEPPSTLDLDAHPNLELLSPESKICDECITPNPENKKGCCVQAKYCTIFGNIVGVPLSRFQTKFQTFIRNSKCSDNGAENYCCAESLIEPTFFDEGNQFRNVTIVEKITEIFQRPVIFQQTNEPPSTFDLDAHPNLELLSENKKCGLSGDGDKIAFGEMTDIDEFPFMALLQYEGNGTDAFRCGGTLINKNYVLTAAHCIKEDLFSVRLGEHDLDKDMDCQPNNGEQKCNSPVQDIPIEEIYVHKFDFRTKVNDVALIRLKRPVEIKANNIGFVCLPTTAKLREKNITRANVAGWGYTEKGIRSNILLKGTLDVNKERGKCVTIYQRDFVVTINEKYLCAIGIQGVNSTDTCFGDSGGPLLGRVIMPGEVSERYVQYGIVSAGPKCSIANEVGGAIYTNVPIFMRWILDKMRP